jgi:hypothetical protein
MSSNADAAPFGSGERGGDEPSVGGSTGRAYGVLIGGQRLLLDGSGAVRVLEPEPIARLPNIHHWFSWPRQCARQSGARLRPRAMARSCGA